MKLHKEVNNRIDFVEQMVQEIYPDEWVLNKDIEAEIERIKTIFHLPANLNMDISKNDIMLRTYMNHGFSIKASVRAYMVRGISLLDIIEKIAERKWGPHWHTAIGPFLDFASGYGTLERMMVQRVKPSMLYTSDIKRQGVDFQTRKFGVQGIYSSYIPEEFEPAVKFKFIFVASLFSHLPISLFMRWLKQLWDSLDEDGVLVFTVHDISLVTSREDFVYSSMSEDTGMSIVEDSIKKTDCYGTTYVSENHMIGCFKELGLSAENYSRYKRASGGTQDIYIVSRDRDLFNNIAFNAYDSEAI